MRPEQLAREVAALANFQGGRILLGVEDDGAVTGIRREHLERWVMDSVFGQIVHPMILPFYEEVPVDDDAPAARGTPGATCCRRGRRCPPGRDTGRPLDD